MCDCDLRTKERLSRLNSGYNLQKGTASSIKGAKLFSACCHLFQPTAEVVVIILLSHTFAVTSYKRVRLVQVVVRLSEQHESPDHLLSVSKSVPSHILIMIMTFL